MTALSILDCLLPTKGVYETFQAWVVIPDGDRAYVGSTNMTRCARHSVELGVIVKARPARSVAALVRAVGQISLPVAVS